MQTQAWYYYEPNGQRHGPSETGIEARIEGARYAARKPTLPDETALTLFRTLEKAGWRVANTKTRSATTAGLSERAQAEKPKTPAPKSVAMYARMKQIAEDSSAPKDARRKAERAMRLVEMLEANKQSSPEPTAGQQQRPRHNFRQLQEPGEPDKDEPAQSGVRDSNLSDSFLGLPLIAWVLIWVYGLPALLYACDLGYLLEN